MKKLKKTETEAAPALGRAIQSAVVVRDFLPSPSELVAKEETVKVTLSLHRSSVEFFKKQAKASQVPYQAMVREVVDLYARRWSPAAASKKSTKAA